MMDWQPIKTAPRDGTPILGWDDCSYMAVVHWNKRAWRLMITGDCAADDEWTPDLWTPISPPEDRKP
jgi:hypothetical protein